MSLPDPAQSVADYIDDSGLAVYGVNLWVGPVRPVSDIVPVDAVFCLATEGREAERSFARGDEVRFEIRYPSVQVRVRSKTYQQGYSLAKAIYNLLESADPFGYQDCKAFNSEPIYLMQDQNNYYHWAINFELFFNYSDMQVWITADSAVVVKATIAK